MFRALARSAVGSTTHRAARRCQRHPDLCAAVEQLFPHKVFASHREHQHEHEWLHLLLLITKCTKHEELRSAVLPAADGLQLCCVPCTIEGFALTDAARDVLGDAAAAADALQLSIDAVNEMRRATVLTKGGDRVVPHGVGADDGSGEWGTRGVVSAVASGARDAWWHAVFCKLLTLPCRARRCFCRPANLRSGWPSWRPSAAIASRLVRPPCCSRAVTGISTGCCWASPMHHAPVELKAKRKTFRSC